ncbi:MAG: hypothetical protein ACRERE_05275 [Candidatus Entotheonellia bacterium]
MELFYVHAYSVSPQRGVEHPIPPEGGAVAISAEFQRIVAENLQSARLESRTVVDFQTDPVARTSSTRDLIMRYAFGESSDADAAALSLACRLSAVMDLRSTPCLLVAAAFRDGDRLAVTLWTFPRDEAFRLRHGSGGPSIEVLTDVFSQTSRLRKAAQFQGRQLRSDFLSGRVLDFQADHASRDVADFWIGRFLECRLGIGGDAGTRLLARTVRRAYEVCDNLEDKEILYTAVMAMRRSPQQRVSLQDFADRYLSGRARDTFINAAPNADGLSSAFDFQRELFDATLQFRIFQLKTGVFVSSPLTEVGESVQITEGRERRLSCEGEIVDERLRTRHA